MMGKLWDIDQELDNLNYDSNDVCLQNYIDISPPPPYSKEDLFRSQQQQKNVQQHDRRLSYNDVGAEMYIRINKKPNEEAGLTILNGEAFNPSWPTILDIRKNSPASRTEEKLLIGDQIKELYGIPTVSLKHSQILALFSKATDEVTMTIRRGVEPSDRSFDWYKHPFSSVSHVYEHVSIQEECENTDICCANCPGDELKEPVLFKSFKHEHDDKENKKIARLQYTTPNGGLRRVRSFSDAYGRKSCAPKQRQRRRTTDHTNNKSDELRNLVLFSLPDNDGKYIADEIEKLKLEKEEEEEEVNAFSPRRSRSNSQCSLASTLSASTVSSFSSNSTSATTEQGISSKLQHGWLDRINQSFDMVDHSNSDGSTELTTQENLRNFAKSPAQVIRNSFRRKKSKKNVSTEDFQTTGKSETPENTHILTVWIADRKRLGLKLGGGCVSAYGDSNMTVRDLKRPSPAAKVFKIGDEVLEIDGLSTNGMTVNEANKMLSRLEGNFVEFKIFRPVNK